MSGLNRERLESLIAGKRDMTLLDAHGLSKAFGTSRELWMNLQRDFAATKGFSLKWSEIDFSGKAVLVPNDFVAKAESNS